MAMFSKRSALPSDSIYTRVFVGYRTDQAHAFAYDSTDHGARNCRHTE